MRRYYLSTLGVTALLLCAVSMTAHGAAYWILEQGNATYGRAGTNIAGADDGSTLYLNPAWLAEFRGFEFVVGANAIKDYRSFERADLVAPDTQSEDGPLIPDASFERADNLATYPRFSPNLFLTYGFDLGPSHALGFGIGIWGPPRADLEYDPNGAQRYGLVSSYNIQAHPAIGFGYGHLDSGFYIGGQFSGVTQIVDTTLKLYASPIPTFLCAEYEDQGCDIETYVYTRTDGIPVWTMGLGWVSDFGLRLGASFQSGFKVNANGTATFTLGETLSSLAEISGEDVAVEFEMPWILRAAIRYADPDGDWDIELAYTREQWSVQQTIDFDASAIGVDSDVDLADIESVGLIQLKPSWRDSESLRLGGALTWDDGAVVTRGGIYYESGAQKRKMMDIGTYDPPKIGITGGIRYILANKLDLLGSGQLYADVSLGYVEWMETEVVSSEAELNDPTTDEFTYIIGNGVYDSKQIITMFALGVRL